MAESLVTREHWFRMAITLQACTMRQRLPKRPRRGLLHGFRFVGVSASINLHHKAQAGNHDICCTATYGRQLAWLSQKATARWYASRSSGTPEPPSSTPSALRIIVIGAIGTSSGSAV